MKDFVVCLDYGHGGYDRGASYQGRLEKDDNLALGKLIRAELEAGGVKVVETRSQDTYVYLSQRVAISNQAGADLFVSLHRNAFMPEKAQGLEVFTYPGGSLFAKDLAYRIGQSLGNIFRNRGAKQANFYVLKHTRAAAILIETGFIDNTRDNISFDKNFRLIGKLISQEILKTF